MGTRALIGQSIVDDDSGEETLAYIHVNYDGHPSNMIPLLEDKFSREKDVEHLISCGDLLSLNEFDGTNNYTKDGPTYYNAGVIRKHWQIMEKLALLGTNYGCEYCYLYHNGQWHYSRGLSNMDIKFNQGSEIIINQRNPDSVFELIRLSSNGDSIYVLHVTGLEELEFLSSKYNSRWDIIDKVTLSCGTVALPALGAFVFCRDITLDKKSLFERDMSEYRKKVSLEKKVTLEWL